MEHSPFRRDGGARVERTPWHVTQRALRGARRARRVAIGRTDPGGPKGNDPLRRALGFYQEDQYCGELDAAVEPNRVCCLHVRGGDCSNAGVGSLSPSARLPVPSSTIRTL